MHPNVILLWEFQAPNWFPSILKRNNWWDDCYSLQDCLQIYLLSLVLIVSVNQFFLFLYSQLLHHFAKLALCSKIWKKNVIVIFVWHTWPYFQQHWEINIYLKCLFCIVICKMGSEMNSFMSVCMYTVRRNITFFFFFFLQNSVFRGLKSLQINHTPLPQEIKNEQKYASHPHNY